MLTRSLVCLSVLFVAQLEPAVATPIVTVRSDHLRLASAVSIDYTARGLQSDRDTLTGGVLGSPLATSVQMDYFDGDPACATAIADVEWHGYWAAFEVNANSYNPFCGSAGPGETGTPSTSAVAEARWLFEVSEPVEFSALVYNLEWDFGSRFRLWDLTAGRELLMDIEHPPPFELERAYATLQPGSLYKFHALAVDRNSGDQDNDIDFSFGRDAIVAVPEPASLALILAGLPLVAAAGRRKRRS